MKVPTTYNTYIYVICNLDSMMYNIVQYYDIECMIEYKL